jgi:hypothetical protein
LTSDALGYLLETARISRQVQGIMLPDGSEMVNNHFADDSLLLVRAEQTSVDGALACKGTLSEQKPSPFLPFVIYVITSPTNIEANHCAVSF